jgi:hypothetical protein
MPTGATPVAELERIASEYPSRDGRGYVTGFYVVRRGLHSGTEAGPFATMEAAETARSEAVTLDVLAIICGHVFTERGTIVRAPAGTF